jgi:hypothetical protein
MTTCSRCGYRDPSTAPEFALAISGSAQDDNAVTNRFAQDDNYSFRMTITARDDNYRRQSQIAVGQVAAVAVAVQPIIQKCLVEIGGDDFFAEFLGFGADERKTQAR